MLALIYVICLYQYHCTDYNSCAAQVSMLCLFDLTCCSMSDACMDRKALPNFIMVYGICLPHKGTSPFHSLHAQPDRQSLIGFLHIHRAR